MSGISGGVAVAGGGPAGSAAAIALAAIGFRVTVFERARYPREKPCAEFLGPGTFAEVSRLLQEPPPDLAPTMEGFRIATSSGASFAGSYGGHPAGAISRANLDTWLARAASLTGADIVEGALVTGLSRSDHSWRLTVRQHGREHDFDALAVVAADGLHSTIAHRLELRRTRRAPDRVALVAHGAIPGLSRFGEMHVRPGAYCGIAPLSDGSRSEANIALVIDRSETRAIAGDLVGYFARALTRFPALRERAAEMKLTREVMAVGPLSIESAPAPPGIFMTGDAASFLDPFTGQGIGRALRSGRMAASGVVALLNGDSHATRRFERRCASTFRGERAVERLIQSFLARPELFDRIVRRLGARPALADALLAVTGDLAPARSVLNPSFFGRLLAPGPR